MLLLAYAATAFSQQVSFSDIDERVKSIEPAPAAELAYTLTKDYTTDKEKVRSIFSWITDHIAYRVKKSYRPVQAASHGPSSYTDTARWKYSDDIVAETVLQNRSAVCDGYARLFKTLCDDAGLRSAVISGFANGDYNRHARFRCNHTWNAVYIDSAWHLLDATWASGYTNYSGDAFIKRYDASYFMAAPEDFIRDHFPDDIRWTLMQHPSFPNEFNNAPYKRRPFLKYNISSFLPATGIIEASIGDTVQITLETADPSANSKITPDTTTLFDSSQQPVLSTVAFMEPLAVDSSKKQQHYYFHVANPAIEWLYVVYNHDTVLCYRLKIRKERPVLAAFTINR